MEKVTESDLSDSAFPFGTAQVIEIGGAEARAIRVTYVGELGWELHCPSSSVSLIYDTLVKAGKPFDLRNAGHYAINAMRIEKAYRAWGHDISSDETPLEAGLSFAVDWETDFIGREALVEQRAQGIRKRLVALVLEDPEPTLWGSEPILCNGETVGYTTSGAYGPTLGAAVAMGYVKRPDGGIINPAFIKESQFEILNDGIRYPAKAFLRSPYDPKREKILR